MKRLVRILAKVVIVIAAIALLLVLLVVWARWDAKRMYPDTIAVKCEYKFVECANQEVYFFAETVSNPQYEFILNSPIGLLFPCDGVDFDSVFQNVDYTKEQIVIEGKLYKRLASNEYYDCYVGAYRFEVIKILDTKGHTIWDNCLMK